MTMPADTLDPPAKPGRTRLVLLLPLAVFLALAGLFLVRLGAGDPAVVPSALIGKAVPAFDLPPLEGFGPAGLASPDLKAGHVTVLNVFASWCAECHEEHAALMGLAQDPVLKGAGAVMAGLVYKDKSDNARRYLGAKGNPFARIGIDPAGRTGIDFGVYGVPETFVVRGNGTIAYKLVGGVNEATRPALMAAIAEAARP